VKHVTLDGYSGMELPLARFTKINSPLLAYAKNVTSQFGEDGIIARLVELIQPGERFCVEFGAWGGKYYSNCHQLLATSDWQGLMIEGNPEKYRDLVSTFAGNDRVRTLNRFVDFEGPNGLDNILAECNAPKDLGLLSIDIDGNDYHIWKSLQGYAPEIVVIEFNPTVPNDVFFVQDASFDVNHGCSLLALTLLGQEKGYELCVCTTTNAFFVKGEVRKSWNPAQLHQRPASAAARRKDFPRLRWNDIRGRHEQPSLAEYSAVVRGFSGFAQRRPRLQRCSQEMTARLVAMRPKEHRA